METSILPSQPDKKTRARIELALAAAAALGLLTNVYVYRPGGTRSGNVYPAWPALAADAAKVQGPKQIEIDGSFNAGAATIPVGAWAMSSNPDVEIRSSGFFDGVATVQTKLTITDGATFPQTSAGAGVDSTCIGKFTGLLVVYAGLTTPIHLSTGAAKVTGNYGAELVLDDTTVNTQGTTAPLFGTSGAGAGIISMRNLAAFTVNGLAAMASATSTLTIEAVSGATIPANTLGTDAGATVVVKDYGGAGVCSPFQSANAGTLTFRYPSNLPVMTANRVSSAALVLAGVASPAGPTVNPFFTEIVITKTTKPSSGGGLALYKVKYSIQVATSAGATVTFTIQARAHAGVYAAVYTMVQTTAAANTLNFSGEVDFDGTAFARLPADASGITDVECAIATSAGTITTVAGNGTLIVEEG